MPKQFIKFFTAATDSSAPASILVNTKYLIAVEKTFSSGVVMIPGAAYTVTIAEAIRLFNELMDNGDKDGGKA